MPYFCCSFFHLRLWLAQASGLAKRASAIQSGHSDQADKSAVQITMQHLSEQEIQRRQKLEELEKLGIEAYPSELFDVTFYAKEIHDN